MRILGSKKNLFVFENCMGPGEFGLYYRFPNTDEIIAHRNGGTRREGDTLVSNHAENRLASGKKILTGIREGDFGKEGPDGNPVPISSDDGSEFYDEDWRDLVEKSASDLIEMLGYVVFEGSARANLNTEEKPDIQGEAGDKDKKEPEETDPD